MVIAEFSYGNDNRPKGIIDLCNGSKWICSIEGIIDSGATFTCIPASLGTKLGFQHSEIKESEILRLNTAKKEDKKGVRFVFRNIEACIGKSKAFKLKAAWLFENECDLLLGADLHNHFKILHDKERGNNGVTLFTTHTRSAFIIKQKGPPPPKRVGKIKKKKAKKKRRRGGKKK